MIYEMINSSRTLRNASVALAIILSTGPAAADQISWRGVVVGVTDGDTLTLLVAERKTLKVRLSAIDAPEQRQAGGSKAKQALSALCFGKDALVNVTQIDRYARSVGEVHCDGKYANEEMVRAGMAWVYRRYAKEGYDGLYAAEREARSIRQGLWADALPVPPWEWRKAN